MMKGKVSKSYFLVPSAFTGGIAVVEEDEEEFLEIQISVPKQFPSAAEAETITSASDSL